MVLSNWFPPTRWKVQLGVAAVLAMLVVAGVVRTSSALASAPIPVFERAGWVDTNVNARAGQTVTITPTGDQIRPGPWWWSGWNGPQGWNSTADSNYPWSGKPRYGLYATEGASEYWVGSKPISFTAPVDGHIYLRINDDVVNNGDGYFQAAVDVY
jgi:hypothetical protein